MATYMKIIYLHQYFKTPDMSGGTRSYEMAKRMVKAGHEVHMITSWTENTDHTNWFEENIEGIHTYWYPNSYNNAMSFSERIKAFIKFAKAASIKAASLKDADIIFATSTPLTIAIPAIVASKLLKIPMVFEVRDLWPEIPIAIGALKNPLLKTLAKKLENWAYKNSSAVIALSPGMKEGIVQTGYPSKKVAVIPNSSDNREFQYNPIAAENFRTSRAWLGDSPLLVYTGTFGKINGVTYMVSLAKELKKLNSSIKILLVGDGAEKETVIANAKSAGVYEDNLFYESQIPKKDIPSLLSASTMASALFIDLPEMRPNSANKFFDALASGTPVFLNYGGWMHDLVNKYSCGITAWQMDISQVAKELNAKLQDDTWLSKAGVSARQLAEHKFDRDTLAQQLIKALKLASEGKSQLVESVAPGEY